MYQSALLAPLLVIFGDLSGPLLVLAPRKWLSRSTPKASPGVLVKSPFEAKMVPPCLPCLLQGFSSVWLILESYLWAPRSFCSRWFWPALPPSCADAGPHDMIPRNDRFVSWLRNFRYNYQNIRHITFDIFRMMYRYSASPLPKSFSSLFAASREENFENDLTTRIGWLACLVKKGHSTLFIQGFIINFGGNKNFITLRFAIINPRK